MCYSAISHHKSKNTYYNTPRAICILKIKYSFFLCKPCAKFVSTVKNLPQENVFVKPLASTILNSDVWV